jgi:hypothetical protein
MGCGGGGAQRLCTAQDAVQPVETVKERGVFLRIMEGLATADAQPKTIMIEATCLKAHRTASACGLKKGFSGA